MKGISLSNARAYLLVILISFFVKPNAFATKIDFQGINININDGNREDLILDNLWRFKIGDDTAFISNNFDYSKWDSVYMPLTQEEFFERGYKGNLWLKGKLEILNGKTSFPISILIKQFGASEIYIDGKLVSKQGKVGLTKDSEEFENPNYLPISYIIDKPGVHIITIRFSNHKDLNPDADESYLECFDIKIVSNEEGSFLYNLGIFKTQTLQSIAIGCFLTLGLLNIILFFFYKRDKTNLIYSLFCLFVASAFLIQLLHNYFLSAEAAVTLQRFNILFNVFSDTSLLTLVFSFTYDKTPKRLWVVYAVAIIAICLIIPFLDIAQILLNILAMYTVIDTIITITIKYFKRYDPNKKKRKIVFRGLILLLVIACIFLFINKSVSLIIILILVSILILPLMGTIFIVPVYMTIRHARSFAATNKNLEAQLEQVKELSAKTLEQEQEKKRILESQNEVLEQQVKERTHELAQKNIEITDSINYAKRIQAAILASHEEVNKGLPNCFILFKPKDIVSGDFYFYSKINTDTVIIAAADCTGHGVPGALMSMIGCEKLELAVKSTGEPTTLLSELNKGVKASLKQTESSESTRDGMDIALLAINTANGNVKYAGANRPMWIIKNNGTEVEEIKATKKAIAGFTDDNQVFEQHELTPSKGDTIYLFSDGYADQFGKTGKKLMTKKFKEMLIMIQAMSLNEQKEYLDKFITEWRGDVEQIDDILVIGIRF